MAHDLKNTLFRFYLKNWFPPRFSAAASIKQQEKIFHRIISQLASTRLGRDLNLSNIQSYSGFRNLPVTHYDFYEPYVERIKAGEQKVMTTGKVLYFGKTAGTTSGKSKLVPITKQVAYGTHIRGTFFSLSRLHSLDSTIDILSHKNFGLTGGLYEKLPGGIQVADISAIMMHNIPLPFRTIYVPKIELTTHPSWDYKINRIAHEVSTADVGTMIGVPTWHLAVLHKIRDEIKFNRLSELWKNLRIFFHGGVNFEPYRQHFKNLLGREDFVFYETYNATEGFFGIQADLEGGDMLLLTDTGVFYEFIPFSKYGQDDAEAIPLSGVKAGIAYVMLITVANGLVRYVIGDVITFSSCDPFKFRITGRTQEYINAFGEDLLLGNVENALMQTNRKLDVTTREYTVAPLYINIESKGRMQLLIEFVKQPADLQAYMAELDLNLQNENSNYAQKRNNSLALTMLQVIPARQGLFYDWLAARGKMGGQNKIPRLANNRKMMEELLEFNNR